MGRHERDYDRGFLDAAQLLLSFANNVLDAPVPESKRFGKLVGAIEHVYACACERYEEDVKAWFLITWKAEVPEPISSELRIEEDGS